MTRSRDVADTQDNLGGAVAPFVAGKNKIINGDFFVNQRAFSSITTSGTYGFDRWFIGFSGGTVTYSAQTFTPGTAPVVGYEGTNFARVVTASQSAAGNFTYLQQRIEDVRTFAGQTVTVSFWAKAATGTPSVGIVFEQQFGTGGSGTVVTSGGTTAITTSWTRYSKTISVPSIAGKTIGTGTVALNLGLMTSVGTTISAAGYPAVGLQNETIDFWGIQVEAGSVATPFTTAGGSIGGELALCQRYYLRYTQSIAYERFGNGMAGATNAVTFQIPLKVTMRVAPTSIDYNSMTAFDGITQSGTGVAAINASGANVLDVSLTSITGLTTYRPYQLIAGGTSGAYIGFSAEL
jgi:hypothetical protein